VTELSTFSPDKCGLQVTTRPNLQQIDAMDFGFDHSCGFPVVLIDYIPVNNLLHQMT